MKNSDARPIDWDFPIRVVSTIKPVIYGKAKLSTIAHRDPLRLRVVEFERIIQGSALTDLMIVDAITGVSDLEHARAENYVECDGNMGDTRAMVELFLKLDFSKATLKTRFGSTVGYTHDQIVYIATDFCASLEMMRVESVPNIAFFVEEFKSQRGFQEWLP